MNQDYEYRGYGGIYQYLVEFIMDAHNRGFSVYKIRKNCPEIPAKEMARYSITDAQRKPTAAMISYVIRSVKKYEALKVKKIRMEMRPPKHRPLDMGGIRDVWIEFVPDFDDPGGKII